jgi:NitT/TauT family transport system substrate-binding protein
MKIKPLIVGILALILAFVLFNRISNKEVTNTELEKVEIGYSALRISLPVFVAQEKGYFEEEGLDVDLTRFDTAQPLMSALVAGTVDIAGYTALPITYNAMLRSQTDLYFLSSMVEDQDHRISYIIVPEDTPSDFTIADLKGKKIGILPTIAYQSWIAEILKANNLDPEKDVEIIQIAPALSPSALASGQVDALFTNDPAATTAIQTGVGRVLSDNVEVPQYLGDPFIFGSFNIQKEYADNNPETLEKLTKAMNKAIDFVNQNPEEAKSLMIPYVHESQKDFVQFYPNALYQKIGEVTEADFQSVADQYLEIGIIKEELALKNLVK